MIPYFTSVSKSHLDIQAKQGNLNLMVVRRRLFRYAKFGHRGPQRQAFERIFWVEEALENGEPKRCLGYGNLEAMEKSNCSHFAINNYFGNVHTKFLGIEGAFSFSQ